ncbi:MAG TPA: four helix bundle protein [Fimbriimonas sp.]|nr:four helix bundle protein [Fimbriimonas sp.]
MRIEDTDMFRRLQTYGHTVWRQVSTWKHFPQSTVGQQWVRATDSVCANLVEGEGRGGLADQIRFFIISRASLRESIFWLVTSYERNLITEELFKELHDEAFQCARMLSSFILQRKSTARLQVKEQRGTYNSDLVDEQDWPSFDPLPLDSSWTP